MQFSGNEKAVMRELKKNSKMPIIAIAKETNLDTKTVVNIKRHLEAKEVIRQYSIVLNYKSLEIEREQILIQLNVGEKQEMKRFLSYCRFHKNILTALKIIGNYDIILTMEKLDKEKDIISELRKEFDILGYKLLKIEQVLKDTTIPYPFLQ